MPKVRKPAVSKATTVVKKKPEPTGDMYLKVGRTDFTNAINLVSVALPSKEYNDAKSGIMLEARYENDMPMLYLTANALDVFVRHGIRLNDDIEEGFVVPNGAFMNKLCRNLRAMKHPLELFYDGTDFQITCGEEYNGTAIKHYDPVGFVTPMSNDEIKGFDTISIPANIIKETLDKVAFACSTDASIISMTAVLIKQTKDGMDIIGTDGQRFSYLGIKAKVRNPKSVMIGVRYMRIIKDILDQLDVKPDQILDLYMSDEKLYLMIGHTTVGIQIYGGEHPVEQEGGYDRFIIPPDKCDVELSFEKEKFLPILNLAVAHNNSTSDIVRMKIKQNSGTLVNGDICDNRFDLEFEVATSSKKAISKKPIEIDFSPKLLFDAIGAVSGKTFKMYLVGIEEGKRTYSGGNMVIVRPGNPGETPEFIHVFSLN